MWPVWGNVARLVVAATGGWMALRAGLGLAGVFAAQGAALVVYGIVNGYAVMAGAWFGPLRWPPRLSSGAVSRDGAMLAR